MNYFNYEGKHRVSREVVQMQVGVVDKGDQLLALLERKLEGVYKLQVQVRAYRRFLVNKRISGFCCPVSATLKLSTK